MSLRRRLMVLSNERKLQLFVIWYDQFPIEIIEPIFALQTLQVRGICKPRVFGYSFSYRLAHVMLRSNDFRPFRLCGFR
jgi:short subunit fatty acids transporter